MATITVTYSEPELDNFCGQYDYQSTIEDPDNEGQTISNPESKTAFLNRKLTEFYNQSAKAYRVRVAQEAAKILAGG